MKTYVFNIAFKDSPFDDYPRNVNVIKTAVNVKDAILQIKSDQKYRDKLNLQIVSIFSEDAC